MLASQWTTADVDGYLAQIQNELEQREEAKFMAMEAAAEWNEGGVW